MWTDTQGPYTVYIGRTDADILNPANIQMTLTDPEIKKISFEFKVPSRGVKVGDKFTVRVNNTGFHCCVDYNVIHGSEYAVIFGSAPTLTFSLLFILIALVF